jgi:hypothetical protein
MFQLKKMRKGVYMLSFTNHIDLCYSFMRYQEFYESTNPRFYGKTFTWAEYIRWYTITNKKEGSNPHAFYYASDWSGFNHPVEVIGKVHDLGISDPNHYDDIMYGIYKMIMTECDKAYLIGAVPGTSTEKHELTHAAFYLLPEYKNKVVSAIQKTHNASQKYLNDRRKLIEGMTDVLFKMGYATSSIVDEINAFATTGDHKFFDKLDKQAYASLKKELVTLHNKHYPEFVKDIK